MELAGIDLFQRPRTSSKPDAIPGPILSKVMAEALRLRGALRPAEGEAWNWNTFTLPHPTGQHKSMAEPSVMKQGMCSTHSGRAQQNRMVRVWDGEEGHSCHLPVSLSL